MKKITNIEQFCEMMHFSPEHSAELKRRLSKSAMPFKVTEFYVKTIQNADYPVRQQLLNIILPPPGDPKVKGRPDPSGQLRFKDHYPYFIQHKYESSITIHLSDCCNANCQYCYKAQSIHNAEQAMVGVQERVDMAKAYIQGRSNINEVFIAGADPFELKIEELCNALEQLFEVQGVDVISLVSKTIVFDPSVFLSPEWVQFVKKYKKIGNKRIRLFFQIDHPAEITAKVEAAIETMVQCGADCYGRSVLAAGINDDVQLLIELQRDFMNMGLKNYCFCLYIPVKGVEQYVLPIDEAFKLLMVSRSHLEDTHNKGALIATCDYGKLEVCGFSPSLDQPDKVVLKWKKIAMPHLLPQSLVGELPKAPHDMLVLDYKKKMYSIDDVFHFNDLPVMHKEGIMTASDYPDYYVFGNLRVTS